MSLSAEDIQQKKPIKTPKTLNPLGAVIGGVSFGEGTVLIYNSLFVNTYHVAFSVLGILLILICIGAIAIAVSLTAKSIEFLLLVDKSKNMQNLLPTQIVLFYLGFTPTFGFLLAYGQTSLVLWKFFLPIGILPIGFLIILERNIKLFRKEEARIGQLLEAQYQPKKVLLILATSIPVLLSLLLVLLLPN